MHLARYRLGLVIILFCFCQLLLAEETNTDPEAQINIEFVEEQEPINPTETENTNESTTEDNTTSSSTTIPSNAFSALETGAEATQTNAASSKLDTLEQELQKSRTANQTAIDAEPERFFNATAFLGIQSDSINWTVKQGAVTEKTEWDPVQSTILGIKLQTTLNQRLHAHIDYHFSLSHSGDGTDTLSSPATNLSGETNDGSYERYSLGIYYTYELSDKLQLGPRLGYFESTQSYNFYNKNITGPSLDSPNEALNSQFDVIWNGLYIGAQADYQINEQLSFWASLDFSLLDYENSGRLNLRPTLKKKSLEQSGDGIGMDLQLGLLWTYSERLTFFGFIRLADWNVDGEEKRFTTSNTTVTNDLSESHFSSILFGAGVDYAF